jgi:hypothetical protein
LEGFLPQQRRMSPKDLELMLGPEHNSLRKVRPGDLMPAPGLLGELMPSNPNPRSPQGPQFEGSPRSPQGPGISGSPRSPTPEGADGTDPESLRRLRDMLLGLKKANAPR